MKPRARPFVVDGRGVVKQVRESTGTGAPALFRVPSDHYYARRNS